MDSPNRSFFGYGGVSVVPITQHNIKYVEAGSTLGACLYV